MEALAAGAILVLSAVVLGQAVVGAMDSLHVARDVQRAAHLLDVTLTKIDLLGPSRVVQEGPTDGTFSGQDSRYRWEAEVESRLEGHLYDVTVRVSWNTPRGQRCVEAATLLNDPPDSRDTTLRWEDL